MKNFLAEIIAEYIERIKYNDIPRAAIEKTKLCILDSIGCALGGSVTDEGKIVIKSLLKGGQGSSTIFGHKIRTSLNSAVFINSTLSNILDFDDTYMGHPGATIVPVALKSFILLFLPVFKTGARHNFLWPAGLSVQFNWKFNRKYA